MEVLRRIKEDDLCHNPSFGVDMSFYASMSHFNFPYFNITPYMKIIGSDLFFVHKLFYAVYQKLQT